MFSKSRKSPRNASAITATGARNAPFSIIGSDIAITGNINATADLHVDGKIAGDIRCTTLVQGAESEIRGSITADSARLAGLVDGAVSARDLIVERSARIMGDVVYENIVIEQGGQVVGRFSHQGPQPTELKLIASDA